MIASPTVAKVAKPAQPCGASRTLGHSSVGVTMGALSPHKNFCLKLLSLELVSGGPGTMESR